VLIIELNEFNAELLYKIAHRKKYRNILALLELKHVKTITKDRYSSGFLEPWVQWVSVHTGQPSHIHKIKHLGDVPSLGEKQIWEKWSDDGLKSIVWGVMNGSRGQAPRCEVFVPDPWTFSEGTTPNRLEALIELPRYLARNYLDISKARVVFGGINLLLALANLTKVVDLLIGCGILARCLRLFGMRNITFILFFEFLSAMSFFRVVQKREPDVAIVFLNSIAHAQHHYWKNQDGVDCREIEMAVEVVDRIVGRFLSTDRKPSCFSELHLMNALSQRCTINDDPWILYRPKNHALLMECLCSGVSRVEPLMTYDAHVFFDTTENAETGYVVLKNAMVNDQQIFHVEKDQSNSRKLFYRVEMTDPVDSDTRFSAAEFDGVFLEHFTAIVQRTGKHVQEADLFTMRSNMPDEIENHMIMHSLKPNVPKSV
jgi:hypothetical protein